MIRVKSEPPQEEEGEEEEEWEDAYARHLALVLSTILFEREDFRELFSAQELALASRFLTELKPFEQQLYARLLQRQGPWYKTTSLFRYVLKNQGKERITQEDDKIVEKEEQEQQPVNEQVQDVIHVMVDTGFFQKFPTTAALSPKSLKRRGSIPDKALSPGRKEKRELARLETALDAIERCATAPELAKLYKKMTGSKKHIAKKDLVAAVRKVAKTQRRIDGSRIPVAQLMQQIWLEAYPLSGRKSSDVMVLRMTPATRDLLLRMHRLFYFVSTPPFNATSVPSQLEDVGQLIALAAHKLRQEPTQWPGLMVFFKKVAYPEYKLTKCSSADDSTAQMLNSHRVFPSSEAYVTYEVAYQLHRIVSVVGQCIQVETPDNEYQEPDLDLKWMLADSLPVFDAFQRLLVIIYGDAETTETDDDCVIVDGNTNQFTKDKSSTDWQIRSWEQFHLEIGKMQTLDDLVLASRGCLHAYLKWMKAAAYSTSGIPVFFSKCNAGYHLVRVLNIAVDLYEKMRKYQIATLLLNELLAAPFLERKRGYWWDRLALNLEHLKCADQAIGTCINALEDPHVLAADRIALERRLHRLERRRDNDERKRVDALSTADLILQNTGTSLITPSDELDNEDEEKAVPAEAHTTYQYRQNHIVGRPLNRQTGEKSRFVGYDDEPCTVEQLVLQYYRDYHPVDGSEDKLRAGGWYGLHSEGSVLRNLFGIFMWDVLYASIPDVFQTPFQSAPLDFGYADVFYESRRDLIERRIAQVKEEWAFEELLSVFVERWSSEYGKVSRFVGWPRDGAAALKYHLLVIAAIGRSELAKLLRYMATSKEFHQAQNGLPDLLLLRFEFPDEPVPLSPGWTMDGHDCLNVHAFCGMDEELNMNEKLHPNVSVADDESKEEVLEEKPNVQPRESILEHVLHLLKGTSIVSRLKLVEVKGPRDHLSDKQLLWLQVLNEVICLDASVMHVEEPEKHAKRKKKEKKTPATAETRKRQTKRRK